MRLRTSLRTLVGFFMAVAIVIATLAGCTTHVWAQERRPNASPFLAPADQVVAVRAGRLYDGKSGTLLTNQVVLIRGIGRAHV